MDAREDTALLNGTLDNDKGDNENVDLIARSTRQRYIVFGSVLLALLNLILLVAATSNGSNKSTELKENISNKNNEAIYVPKLSISSTDNVITPAVAHISSQYQPSSMNAYTKGSNPTLSPHSTPSPHTQSPFTPSPFTPSPFTPSPFTPSPFTPSPFTHTPFTPSPFTPSPFTPSPFTPSPFTESPFTNAPYTHSPFTESPFTPAPFTHAPFTESPLTKSPLTDKQILKSIDPKSDHSNKLVEDSKINNSVQTPKQLDEFIIPSVAVQGRTS